MTSYSFQAQRLVEQAHSFTEDLGEDPTVGGELASEALVYAVLSVSEQLHKLVATQAPAGPSVFYRAESSGITLGHYATREQARAHCVADADQADLTDLRWVTDTGVHDAPEADELWGISGSDSEPLELDFRVTPITVQAAYDPETEG